MNVLVIGGCGFIGSHLVDALLATGHTVRVMARTPERFRPPLPNVDYHRADFRDRMALAEALTGMDAVYHLVSTTFPGTANLSPRTDAQDNLIGAIDLMDTMLDLGITRLLFMSSGGTVYGVPETVPIPEGHPLRPINSYGIIKVAIEQYLDMYRRTRGLSPVIIRAANPYGPRQGHTGVQGVVSTLLDRIATGTEFEVWGDGSVVRDFIDVRDLANLCVIAGASQHEGAYNAGSGAGTSLNDLIDVTRRATKREIAVAYKPARLIDVPVSVLDCNRAKEDFGWVASGDLFHGVKDTWEWKSSVDQDHTNP